jgi:hypothetical protein
MRAPVNQICENLPRRRLSQNGKTHKSLARGYL